MTIVPPVPRRSVAERPAPGWDLVLRRNSIERLKRERPPLRVRSELAGLIARGYEEIPEEDVVRLYWWGLAHDKPKVGTFMVRVKVPGGRVTPVQLRALGRIAGQYGRDQAELTTRQGIQLHWVVMAALPEVLDAIDAAGQTTAGAEGDTVRNVTSCPVAGLDPGELFDVSGVVGEVAAFFSGNPEYSNLPRKHKYTISACPAQCNAPEIHDVALVGVLRDGEPGFAVRVGGGMSNTPRISRDLGVFVPVPQALDVLRAITDAWQHDLRYRMSRAKARIKFMVDDYGPDGVRGLVEERLGRRLAGGAAPGPVGEADHMGVQPQRQEGLVYVGVPVPSGRVTGSLLRRLADLCEEAGADVRFTRQQNLIVGNVPAGQLNQVRRVLRGIGLPAERSRAFARSVACTSHQFCNYSVAETKGKLDEILGRLVSRFGAEAVGDLTVHMDGCPHACAQHWIGEIGLQGTTAPAGGGERVEAYDLTIGGGLGRRTAIGRRLLRRVPADQVDQVLERLVAAWLAAGAGRDGYRFGDFCADRGDEELAAIGLGTAQADAPAGTAGPQPPVLAVPGPLLPLVEGADRLELAGATVGAALTAVAGSHPEFGAAVLPGGKVAPAYLVTVGDEDIRCLAGLETPLTPGVVVGVVMAMAGG